MKVPMRWLREFVATDLPAAEIAHRLTMAGLEAEKIERIGAGWDNVLVGRVASVTPHPDADRLVLARVVAGETDLTVVTGAPNIAAGQKVALALAGAELVDAYAETPKLKRLKPGTIRGVRSEGMVCSEKELGLSDEHEGILVLEDEAPEGMTLADWLGDTVIEFEITPNLAHAFSVLGIAREAAAVTGATLTPPTLPDLDPASRVEGLVTVQDPDLCPRYLAVHLEGITVGPSPAWLVRRLAAAGIRSITNVVDITNYVMLEYGQPTHAFDFDRLAGQGVIVRRARAGETIETLDHQRRTLGPDMLVIADAERPVGVAGVIGGLESEVTAETNALLLEVATFAMGSVRRTARALGVRTDASARYERGLDPELAGEAAARAVSLLLDLCPGSRVVANQDVYPAPVRARTIAFPVGRIERVLGIALSDEQVTGALGRLGFAPRIEPGDGRATLTVTVPAYRRDVTIREDVIEEVARLVGYDALPETLPAGRTPAVQRDPLALAEGRARRTLVGLGCDEVMTYVTTSDDDLRALAMADTGNDVVGFLHKVSLGDAVRLVNPMQRESDILRPTLIPSLLRVVRENLKHETAARVFEIARVYLPTRRDALPDERSTVALVMAGERSPLSRFDAAGPVDFWDLKGAAETFLVQLGLDEVTYRPLDADTAGGLHPGRSAEVVAGGVVVGRFGEVRPDTTRAFELPDRVFVSEFDLPSILDAAGANTPAIAVPRFLPVEQDFAIVVAADRPAAEVSRVLESAAGPLASGVTLFDDYRDVRLGEGKKSLAFRVRFTAPDRALTDAELEKTRARIERTLKKDLDATLRT